MRRITFFFALLCLMLLIITINNCSKNPIIGKWEGQWKGENFNLYIYPDMSAEVSYKYGGRVAYTKLKITNQNNNQVITFGDIDYRKIYAKTWKLNIYTSGDTLDLVEIGGREKLTLVKEGKGFIKKSPLIDLKDSTKTIAEIFKEIQDGTLGSFLAVPSLSVLFSDDKVIALRIKARGKVILDDKLYDIYADSMAFLEKIMFETVKEATITANIEVDPDVSTKVLIQTLNKLWRGHLSRITSNRFVLNESSPASGIAPVPIKKVAPIYPESARRAGIEGTVWMNVWVDERGNVSKAQIQRSDNKVLNQAAIDAAMQWKFKPAQENGHSVKAWVTIPFKFKLQ